MTWVRIEDTLPDNQKLLGVSLGARWAYISSICYASRGRTDGFVPTGALGAVHGSKPIAQELVAAGLWEVAAGGWAIHDYLKHNRSRDAIESRKAVNSENAAKRFANRSAIPSANRNAIRTANGLRIALSGSGSADPSPLPRPGKGKGAAEAESESQCESQDAITRMIRLWEHATGGLVTPMLGDSLAASLEVMPEEWVGDAIRETGSAGAKSWKYTSAILDRWAREGRDGPREEPVDDAEAQKRRYFGGQLGHLVGNR